MSGKTAQRGYIVQTVVAMIECLERNDWDEIEMEPKTKLDQVDFRLYHDNEELTSIQVKSTVLRFGPTEVKEWLEKIRKDADGNRQECLVYLVGDSFSQKCEDFIAENPNSIKKTSLATLEDKLASTMIEYVRSNRLETDVTISDLVFLEDILFSLIHRNSIKNRRLHRETIDNAFQSVIKVIPYWEKYQERVSLLLNTTSPYYTKDEQLFKITWDFLNYNWMVKVDKILQSRDLSDGTRDALIAIIRQDKQFSVRRDKCIEYLNKTDTMNFNEESRKTRDKITKEIKDLSFGNCLFLCGRYGIGKTSFLKELICEAAQAKQYVCYCDLIKTNGILDETIMLHLIQEYFGVTDGNAFSFIRKHLKASGEDECVVFAIDNLDYAFQQGLQPRTLIELLKSYSISEKIKWIFTIQSEQRYLAWWNNNLVQFAKEYGFVSDDDSEKKYFREHDLDMDMLSEEARIFESVLQKATIGSYQYNEDICLRKNHKYDAYLSPYFAELLIKLEWDWETIANVKHLAYRELCQDYKKQLLDNVSEYDQGNCAVINRRMKASNLCVDIGEQQINTGSNSWLETENPNEKELITSLIGVGVIEAFLKEISDGRFQKEYVATDNLFWAEQTAEIIANKFKALSFKEKLDVITADTNPVSKLPYYIDLQRLYFLLLLQKDGLFNRKNQESIWKGILPDDINSLFSTQMYPRVAEALSFASKEDQKQMFFLASLLFIKCKMSKKNDREKYMYLSTFFEYCSTIQLLSKDWEMLISVFTAELPENRMERIMVDFSVLLWKKRSELSADLLNKILVQLGNFDASFCEHLAETLAERYFALYSANEQLIRKLLSDDGLCRLEKRYIIAKGNNDHANQNWRSRNRIVTGAAYPYCFLESVISKICDRIIWETGVIEGHRLFWENDWYDRNWDGKNWDNNRAGKNPPHFFSETRRKSLNLALTNIAKNNNYEMRNLECLIENCLHHPEEQGNIQRVYREEALFLCRNSVLADERSPVAFTKKIYDMLVGFVTDPTMKSFFKQPNVRRFYAKHNLFALFYDCNIRLKLKWKPEAFECHVDDYSRESIMISRLERGDVSQEEVSWSEIEDIQEFRR